MEINEILAPKTIIDAVYLLKWLSVPVLFPHEFSVKEKRAKLACMVPIIL